jgi:hypothetical protein
MANGPRQGINKGLETLAKEQKEMGLRNSSHTKGYGYRQLQIRPIKKQITV